jgi:hypothetical protein
MLVANDGGCARNGLEAPRVGDIVLEPDETLVATTTERAEVTPLSRGRRPAAARVDPHLDGF